MAAKIAEAPTSFNGNPEELYDGWARHVLLDPLIVEEFHRQFCAYYLESTDPLYLVRMVSGQERGQTLRTEYGQLRPTDNSPAWWIHYQLFSGHFRLVSSFPSFVESIPCHMFKIRLPVNINQAGWHVAHIFDAKDRNVAFHSWDRRELLRRTARNIHPCNYFYIPKTGWQSRGGDPIVIAFFYEKFKSLYRSIWEDYLLLVDGKPPYVNVGESKFIYSFTSSHKEQRLDPTKREILPTIAQPQENPATGMGDKVIKVYKFSRLCFKADVIEPLGWDDIFCVVTPEGTFAMTKRQFYETFSNVVETSSYKQDRIFHYPKTPKKALQFKLDLSDLDK